MSDWIRRLMRPSGASSQWHVARDKGFTGVTTFCGEQIRGPLETASSEERTERDGHCATCGAKLAEKRAATGVGATAR